MNNKYLLDTNICIYLLKGQRNIAEKIMEIGAENCYISDITLAELWYGAANSGQKEKQCKGVIAVEKLFKVLPIHEVVELFADNKVHLRQTGMIMDDFDIFIGSTAVRYGLVMVTENIKHLSRIPNITIKNWASTQ